MGVQAADIRPCDGTLRSFSPACEGAWSVLDQRRSCCGSALQLTRLLLPHGAPDRLVSCILPQRPNHHSGRYLSPSLSAAWRESAFLSAVPNRCVSSLHFSTHTHTHIGPTEFP